MAKIEVLYLVFGLVARRAVNSYKGIISRAILLLCLLVSGCKSDVHVYETATVSSEGDSESVAKHATVVHEDYFFPLQYDISGTQWLKDRRSMRVEFESLHLEPESVMRNGARVSAFIRVSNVGNSTYRIPAESVKLEITDGVTGVDGAGENYPAGAICIYDGIALGRVQLGCARDGVYREYSRKTEGPSLSFEENGITIEPGSVAGLGIGLDANEFREGLLHIAVVKDGETHKVSFAFALRYIGSYRRARY